ncbi:hypothetical protein U3516DRAFT_745846 [Neocallimastix sp. 'constans']
MFRNSIRAITRIPMAEEDMKDLILQDPLFDNHAADDSSTNFVNSLPPLNQVLESARNWYLTKYRDFRIIIWFKKLNLKNQKVFPIAYESIITIYVEILINNPLYVRSLPKMGSKVVNLYLFEDIKVAKPLEVVEEMEKQ